MPSMGLQKMLRRVSSNNRNTFRLENIKKVTVSSLCKSPEQKKRSDWMDLLTAFMPLHAACLLPACLPAACLPAACVLLACLPGWKSL